MLAILIGDISLLFGLAVLMLPLLITELSRPKDSFAGVFVLLFGLVLVTSSQRFAGAPMLAVVSAGALIGRLSWEVGQARWNQLSLDEKQDLASIDRWFRSLNQFFASFLAIPAAFLGFFKVFLPNKNSSRLKKKWVRSEKADKKDTKNESFSEKMQSKADSHPVILEQQQKGTSSEDNRPSKDS